jgi:hypothetical protein
MADDTITKTLDAMRAEPYRGCSNLYRWLRKHHAELTTTIAAYQTPLRVLLEKIHAEGIVGARGQNISYDSLRQTWKRVCRDVAREAARPALPLPALSSPNTPRPSKTPAAWRPSNVLRAPEVPSAAAPVSQAAPPTRPLKVFRSLEDIQPPQQSELVAVRGPEPQGSGLLPPPKWPKPVL